MALHRRAAGLQVRTDWAGRGVMTIAQIAIIVSTATCLLAIVVEAHRVADVALMLAFVVVVFDFILRF